MNSLEIKYKVSDKVIMSSIGDEAVLLDPIQGSYYGVNEVGLFILSQMNSSSKTVQELIELVYSEYDVDQSECIDDVKELIAELLKVGVIIVDN